NVLARGSGMAPRSMCWTTDTLSPAFTARVCWVKPAAFRSSRTRSFNGVISPAIGFSVPLSSSGILDGGIVRLASFYAPSQRASPPARWTPPGRGQLLPRPRAAAGEARSARPRRHPRPHPAANWPDGRVRQPAPNDSAPGTLHVVKRHGGRVEDVVTLEI